MQSLRSQRRYAAALAALLALCTAPAWAQSNDLLARSLAATCANCHGTDGQVRGDAVRKLAGLPAEVTIGLMSDYKSGAKTGTIMHQIAKGYTDEQIKLIAGYFAAQKK